MKTTLMFKKNITSKKAFLLGAISILFLFLTGCQSNYAKLDESKVNYDQRIKAQEIASSILYAQKAGEYDIDNEILSARMQKALTPTNQKKCYEDIRTTYGDFTSLDYVETYIPKKGSNSIIYRFLGKFSKNTEKPEVRVILNENGKLAGLSFHKWNFEME